MLLHNLLLLRNRLQRLILALRFLLTDNSNQILAVSVLLRFILVLRPHPYVLKDVVRENVADAAAGFAFVVALFVDAAVLFVAGVGDFLVGEHAACAGGKEEEGWGQELHGRAWCCVVSWLDWFELVWICVWEVGSGGCAVDKRDWC